MKRLKRRRFKSKITHQTITDVLREPTISFLLSTSIYKHLILIYIHLISLSVGKGSIIGQCRSDMIASDSIMYDHAFLLLISVPPLFRFNLHTLCEHMLAGKSVSASMFASLSRRPRQH